jgi:carbon-monoxide dehydrogenase large subunit
VTPLKFGIGQAVRRKEDDALLRGAGSYVADRVPFGSLHAIVLRSPHARARFRIADLAKASAMPGVVLILTGADTTTLGNLPCQGQIPGVAIEVPPYSILAASEVRHVGDAVAFVVGDTVEQAKDAAEAIEIEWEPLPAAIGGDAALREGAPLVWPQLRSNVAFETTLGDGRATEQAFAKAARVVTLDLVNQRLVANYLDTRAVVAEYEASADRLTLTLSSQGSHLVRDALSIDVLHIAPEKLRVITPDVGGGFGAKLFPYREYALAAVAARKLARPVVWIADRGEHFLADTQGRDNITRAKLALDEDGRFLALDVDLVADMGAYLSFFAPFIPFIGAEMLPGVYDIAACHIRIRGIYTNTVPVDAYRGAGRPEAAYVIERLVDAAARELLMEPEALRRAQFHQAKRDALYDRNRQGLRFRRVRRAPQASAGCRRLESISAQAFGLAKSRAAARHRNGDLYRSLRQQRAGYRDCTARTGRRYRGADRIAINRAGTSHRLCAHRCRTSRPSGRPGPYRPRRYRCDRERAGHWRIELDHLRGRLDCPRRGKACR